MRSYVKPELYCETFELSQHIATCGIDVLQANTNECNAQLDSDFWGMNDTVFNAGEPNCTIDIGVIDVYCHTSGTSEAGKLFAS